MSNRGSKRKVYVTPYQGTNLRYGFATNIDAAQSAQLGHTELNGPNPAGYIFGANSPKPARASRRFATGIISSFIDVGSIVAARAAGWSVGRGKRRGASSTTRSKTVYVTIDGVKYAWQLPAATEASIGGLATLGIQVATNTDDDLVFGASTPKPDRAKKTVINGAEVDIITTFFDPTVTLPADWSVVASDKDPLQG